jgi:hypothetical protein
MTNVRVTSREIVIWKAMNAKSIFCQKISKKIYKNSGLENWYEKASIREGSSDLGKMSHLVSLPCSE